MDSILSLIPVPAGINAGLSSARQATMIALLGHPRTNYTAECAAVTARALATKMVTEDVGPFRVTGLRPAVESLRAVLVDVHAQYPDVYAALGSAGMLCVRRVRGSMTAISNHSWGTAIDLTLAGKLDPYGDGTVQRGLALIAPIFNRHGWYWGAAFGKEDAMHFEVADQTLRAWHAKGLLISAPPPVVLSIGDRGPEVAAVQRVVGVRDDGIFGAGTEKAVAEWQGRHGLKADGHVGPRTLAAMGLAAAGGGTSNPPPPGGGG